MREGWTYKTFRDVCFSISDGDWIEKKDQSPDGIRLIQTGNIGVGRFIPKDDSKKFISLDTFKRLRCTEIKEGDILISRLPQPLGRSCVLPKLETRCITAVDCCILRLDSKITLPQYFIYYTQSQNYFSEINSQSSGTTRARITRKKLEETKIPLAPLSEQQRIVSRLDSAFAKIDALKANAKKQLDDAKALFQKALEKAMEPKEGWEEKKLGDIASIFSGYAFKSTDFKEQGKYQVLRIGNIKQNHIRLSEKPVFIENVDKSVLNRSKLEKGDLVVTQTGTRHKRDYGFVAMINNDHLLLNQRNACVRFNDVMKAQFFLYYSYTEFYKDDFFADEGGTVGQGNVGLSALKEMRYYAPPISEQQRIVERLDALSEKVKKLEERQEKTIKECDALKQAILREVFE